ncbi:hypothetical protein RB213_000569 [Colletotrichum asianum]
MVMLSVASPSNGMSLSQDAAKFGLVDVIRFENIEGPAISVDEVGGGAFVLESTPTLDVTDKHFSNTLHKAIVLEKIAKLIKAYVAPNGIRNREILTLHQGVR